MEKNRNYFGIAVAIGTACVVLSVLLKGWALLSLCVFLITVMALKRELGIFTRIRLWVLMLLPVLTGALFIGKRDLHLLVLKVSVQGALDGLQMSGRALCLFFSFSIVLSRVTTGSLINFFEKRGFRGIGLALGVAVNALSTISQNSVGVYHTIRLRGGFRKRPIKSCALFVVGVISSSLRHADDIVHAAMVRGFDTERR